MSVNAALGKFKRASKDLQACWGQTIQYWRDDNCRHFEAEYLQPLLTRLRTAEAAMSAMEDALVCLRRECE